MPNIIQKIFSKLKFYYITLFKITELKYKIYGVKTKLDLSKAVDKRLFLNGFEKDTIDYFCKTIKEKDIVLDIGANIGIYSLIAGKRVGKFGKVYAFEPATKAYNNLLSNIELNKFDNIIPIKSGVSECSGTASFNICEDDAFNSLGGTPMREIVKKETIELTSIDDFVKKNNIKKIDVIKVDTEGAEYLVFKGAEKTINIYKPILFFENNPSAQEGFKNNSNDLLKLIRSNNYRLYELENKKLVEIKMDSNRIVYDIIAISNH